MFVSRFTSFVEDFVISCDEITKFLCPRYCIPSSLSARSPCDSWFACRPRYFGLLGSESKILCFRDATFIGRFQICVMRNICGCWYFCGFWYFCDLEVLCEVLQPFGNTFVAVSLLHVIAGSNEMDRSCGGDVQKEAVEELDDSLGTTNGTKFLVLQKV